MTQHFTASDTGTEQPADAPARPRAPRVYFTATVGGSDLTGPEGWRPYVRGTVVDHDVDAAHDEMTAPHVLPRIARVVDEYLEAQQ